MLKPVVTAGLAPNGPSQINAAADFAEQGWRFRGGTSSDRAALPSGEKFDGLIWADTDNSRGIYEWNGAAWLPITRAMAQHGWTYDRSSANATDTFASGSFASLAAGTITGAPAGEWELSAQAVLSASADIKGNLRVMAGGTSLSLDQSLHVTTIPDAKVMASKRFAWAGGDMLIAISAQIDSGTGTVTKNGTFVSARFIGQ